MVVSLWNRLNKYINGISVFRIRKVFFLYDRIFVGDVLTFGSNQYGQLGAGDIAAHHRIVRVRVPRASSVAAGSNHTVVLTRDGELYTFGNYQVREQASQLLCNERPIVAVDCYRLFIVNEMWL